MSGENVSIQDANSPKVFDTYIGSAIEEIIEEDEIIKDDLYIIVYLIETDSDFIKMSYYQQRLKASGTNVPFVFIPLNAAKGYNFKISDGVARLFFNTLYKYKNVDWSFCANTEFLHETIAYFLRIIKKGYVNYNDLKKDIPLIDMEDMIYYLIRNYEEVTAESISISY